MQRFERKNVTASLACNLFLEVCLNRRQVSALRFGANSAVLARFSGSTAENSKRLADFWVLCGWLHTPPP